MAVEERSVPGPPVRVLLVDDHSIVRSGLKTIVDAQPDMAVVGEAADGVAAVEAAAALQPDVVVMDLSLPKLGGAEATEQIKAAFPALKVLALTAHEEQGYVQLLMSIGASGYVVKRSAAEVLVRAIRAVVAGGVYLDPGVAAYALASGAPAPAMRRTALR